MSFVKLNYILLFWCAFVVTTLASESDNGDLDNKVNAFIDHLRNEDNQVYNYKNPKVLNLQQMNDIAELTLDVEAECLNVIPDLPCQDTSLLCTGYIVRDDSSRGFTVRTVDCRHKPQIVVDSPEVMSYEPSPPTSQVEENNGVKKIELSHETVSSAEVEEPFVAVKKNRCCGFATDVDPSVEGVDVLVDTALRQVEADKNRRHSLVKILRLQKQVVAGIKYILLLEIAPTTCEGNVDLSTSCPIDESAEHLTCEIEFIEKVWINKDKHIIANNCTKIQHFDEPQSLVGSRNDIDNEVSGYTAPGPKDKPKPETSYEDRLRDLESQILPDQVMQETTQPQPPKDNTISKDPPKLQSQDAELQYIEDLIEPVQLATNTAPMEAQDVSLKKNVDPVGLEPPKYDAPAQHSFYEAPTFNNEGYNNFNPNMEFEPTMQQYYPHLNALPPTDSRIKVPAVRHQPKPQTSNYGGNPLDLESQIVTDQMVQETAQPQPSQTVPKVSPNSRGPEPPKYIIPPDYHTSAILESFRHPLIYSVSGVRFNNEDFPIFEPSTDSEVPTLQKHYHDLHSFDSAVPFLDQHSTTTESRVNQPVPSHKLSSTFGEDILADYFDIFPEEWTNEGPDNPFNHDLNTDITDFLGDDPVLQNSGSNIKSPPTESSTDVNTEPTKIPEIKDTKLNSKNNKNENEQSKDSKSSEENSSEENEDHSGERHSDETMQKRDTANNDASSSSSSGSSSEEDNNDNHEKPEKHHHKHSHAARIQEEPKDNVNDDDDSSSSSSSDEENGNHKSKRNKRSLGQMEKISQHEKPLVRDLADFVAATLDHKDDDNHRNLVLQILGAKKLKLEGVYYSLILRLGISRCLEDKYGSYEECREKLFENQTKICKVQVHVDEDYSNPKIVKSQCQNIKKDEFDRNRTNYSRYRRGLRGAPKKVPNDDKNALKFLHIGLNHLDSSSGDSTKLKVKEILEVTSQVVSGTLWKIKAKIVLSNCDKSDTKNIEECDELPGADPKVCQFSAWEQPWLNNGPEITISCDNDAKIHKFRAKRQVLGGETEQPVDSTQALEYLKTGLAHLDSSSGDATKLKVKKVLKVTSQVVSGIVWKIKAEVILSDCQKSDSKDIEKCGELNGASSKVCNFKVWEQAWKKNGQEIEIQCENEAKTHKFRAKRQVPGGQTEQPVDSTKALEYLKTGLAHLDSSSGDATKLKVKKVLKVTSQVVSGSLWRIKAEIILSDCEKSDNKDIQQCGELSGASSKVCDFKIWDQPWLKEGKQIEIQCENDAKTHKFRSRRQVLGGETEQPVDNTEALEYLKTGLAHLDSSSGDATKLKVKKVLKVTSQVVSGIVWKIKAEVILSDCQKSDSKDIEKCGELNGASSKVCNFKVWEQAWKKNGQEIEIQCENEAKTHKFRAKRQVPGGQTEQPVDSTKALEYLKTGLAHLDSSSGDATKLKVKKVLKVTSQVVSGSLWRIKAEIILSDCEKSDNKDIQQCGELSGASSKVCDFKIWDQPWLKEGKQIEIQCENDAKTHKFRSRRQVLGGETEQPVDNTEALEYLKTGLAHLDSSSGDATKLKVKKVLKVTSQVVSGIVWKIKAEVILSDCQKSDSKDIEKCGELNGASSKVCNFKVWEQAWKKNGQEIEIQCENEAKTHKFRAKRQVPGGQTEQPVDSTKALEYLKTGLAHLDSSSGDATKLKVKKVLKVTSQVVSGSLWRVKAEIILSDCEKSDNKDIQQCGELSGASSKVCDFKIWDQPWLKEGKQIEIQCENDAKTHKFRSRRQVLVGGETEQSVDNTEALEYLKTGLAHLDSSSGDATKLKVKKVLKVTSQVVSGSLWRIKAEVILSDCEKSDSKDIQQCGELSGASSKICDFKIWDQPWLKEGKQIEIQCENDAETHKFRSRRQVLVGGETEQSVDNTEALEYLKTGLAHLDSSSGDATKLKVKKVLKVTSQVVSGSLWRIKAEVILSDCEKSDSKDIQQCGELSGASSKVCDFKIWDQPWLKEGKQIEIQCENDAQTHKFRSRRQVLGGETEQPVDNTQALEYLKTGLAHLDSSSGDATKLKVKKVFKVTSQVVSGSLWRIKAEVILSDCEKSDSKDIQQCGELSGASSKVCDFKIWDQPWLKEGKQIEIQCENDAKTHKFRSKRQTLGGQIEQPLDNPKAINYVLDGLLHLDSMSNHQNKYRIQEILSVTKQIVSGQLWRIRARVVLSDCAKDESRESQDCGQLEGAESNICEFQIWDQPWLPHGRNTEIKCDNDEKTHQYRSRRSLETTDDLNVPNGEIKKYLKRALDYLDTTLDFDNSYVLDKIYKIKWQPYDNTWYIKASIGLSDGTSAEIIDGETTMCIFRVQLMDRAGHKTKTNITCENDAVHYVEHTVPKLDNHEVESKFLKFSAQYNKLYANRVEYMHRLNVFKANLKIIEKLNRYEQGTATYGITKFADMTPEEFSRSHGLRHDLRSENNVPWPKAIIPDVKLPVEFDWRTKGAVTEVKDQGQCGSCWAFSTTGNVEGQYAIKNGKLLEFSEQELVDCDTMDDGCSGGLMDNAYRMIEKLGGLELEQDYPYDAEDEKCHFSKAKARVQLSGALNISHDETDMAKWLVKNGPISIAINANAMQFYVGGVSHPWKMLCNPKNLDHGVLIVGYGVHKYSLFNKTLPYWIVKNSWGPSWGEQGYYRVYRGDGTCGLNQTPSSAIVA
ncbi:uncharacterized protein LOC109602488 isoform X4 [Aethina tumida]|uniref:uncharacterized protein LOC109602488 isoform X4 n=1 Tax=Aethina tumida TaxID=116153 RepID=UPI0021477DD0|nr:uncharacterized protein LOC109602488 isoform X4 [Aethina tumida]